jgi:hypothetical protein
VIPPRNSWYRSALAASAEPYSRVEVWRQGIQVDELRWVNRSKAYTANVPAFYDGSVRASLGSRVTRTLSLTVPGWLYPWAADDLLNPYGTELRAFKGLRYGNDTPDEFPCFVGTIEKMRPAQNGVCKVEAADTALRVSGAGFVVPLPSNVGASVLDEFERLVRDAHPLAEFGEHDAITTLVPQLSYDDDRGAALDSLAKAASANWYTLADGRFVMRWLPWTSPAVAAPIVLMDGLGGTVIEAYPERSTDGIYNQVTVTSDRPDGGDPLYATAVDNDPTSPTWVSGPFGRRSIQVRVTGATEQGQLLGLAKDLVQRSRTLTSSWQVTIKPDASIELGDTLDITYQGHRTLQYVASFSIPLGPQGSMSLECRDLANTGAEE